MKYFIRSFFIRESQRGIIKPYSQSNEKDE